jgi:hypothetical protein
MIRKSGNRFSEKTMLKQNLFSDAAVDAASNQR